jgi:hypothetical protein
LQAVSNIKSNEELLMIIWGSKGKESTIGTGQFFCPRCQRTVDFQHQRVQRYFTLYFIPLFPTATLGEYIACRSCGGKYKPEVLRMKPAALAPWVCPKCSNRNPAEQGVCVACSTQRPVAPLPVRQTHRMQIVVRHAQLMGREMFSIARPNMAPLLVRLAPEMANREIMMRGEGNGGGDLLVMVKVGDAG